jgi:hypothetical protein
MTNGTLVDYSRPTLLMTKAIIRLTSSPGIFGVNPPAWLSKPAWISIVASALLGAPLYAVFLALLLAKRELHPTDQLSAYVLAGSWLLLAPGLISLWDHRISSLIGILLATPSDNWDTNLLGARCGLARRLYRPLAGALIALVLGHFVLEYSFYQGILAVGPRWSIGFWLGVVSVGFLAWTFATGIWGVIRTLLLVDVTCDNRVAFNVYRAKRALGVEYSVTSYYLTGLYFSLGNVLAPAVMINFFRFEFSGKTIAVAILACLWLGGASCFIYTTIRHSRTSNEQMSRTLDRFSDALEDWSRKAGQGRLSDLQKQLSEIEAVVQLRSATLEATSSPGGVNVFKRTAVLLIIPAFLSALQPLLGALLQK